jgi:hypothetical protein
MTFVPTPGELRDILVEILAGATDKAASHWRTSIGQVRSWRGDKRPFELGTQANGTPGDVELIERAAAIVRTGHPCVTQA